MTSIGTIIINQIKETLQLKKNNNLNQLTPEEIELLINHTYHILQGQLQFTIEPTTHTDYHPEYHQKTIILNHYPIQEILGIKTNNNEIPTGEYYLHEETGIIHLQQHIRGDLEITYTTGLTINEIQTLITPLLTDMIIYENNKDNNTSTGAISSIKEGDVTVSYDNNTNLYNNILSRIEWLNNKYVIYNAKAKLF